MVVSMQSSRCLGGSPLGRGACVKWLKEPLKSGLLSLLREHNASMDVEGPYIKNSQRFRTKITLGRWLWQGAHLYFPASSPVLPPGLVGFFEGV